MCLIIRDHPRNPRKNQLWFDTQLDLNTEDAESAEKYPELFATDHTD